MDMEKDTSLPSEDFARGEADPDTLHRLPRRLVVLTMGGAMLALFLSALDQTVVSTAMPRIVTDLGGFDRYTWVTTSYLVASTTIVPIIGRLTDMYGRKWFFIGAIIIFLLGSVLAGLSQSMGQLIASRAVQGLGGGAIMAISFVTVGDLFPPSERGKYQGFLAAVFGISSVLGPTLGGVITDQLSWRWIFYINLLLGIPVVALFVAFFPQIRPSDVKHRLDYLGTALLVLAVVPLMLALSWGGVQYPWASVQVLGFLVFSLVMAGLFVAVETHAPEPIVPLSLFRNRVVSLSLVTIFLTGFAMFGAIIFVPLFFQGVLGSSATSSGSFLTPMMLGMVVGATLSGQALSRLGGHYRLQGLVGLAIMAVGAFLVSRMTAETGFGPAVFNLVLMGFGLGITFPTYTIAVQNTVPYRFMGVATSSTQFFRTMGGTLGLALLGSLMTNRFASELTQTVPQGVKDALPTGTLSSMAHNPQALMNPETQAGLQETFSQMGPQGAGLLQQLLDALRASLSTAIGEVFLIAVAVTVVAWLATLFIKEIPLKGRTPEPVDVASGQPQPRGAGDS